MTSVPTVAGGRVLVTRRPEQSRTLVDALTAIGVAVVEVPLVTLAPPLEPGPLRQAAASIDAYGWIVLTSANAVDALAAALEEAGRAVPAAARIASVGPATSRSIRERLRAQVALEPSRDFQGEGLLAAFGAVDVAGHRLLMPVSDRAREVLPAGLRGLGAVVDVVVAYRTVTPPDTAAALTRALERGIDLVTLASPSAVEGLTAALGPAVQGVPAAVIGPITERAARAAGLDVRVRAEPATTEGLVAAVRRHFAGAPSR
jgi:uroporphyrinogen-III synthase